jgi:hypothetical protein
VLQKIPKIILYQINKMIDKNLKVLFQIPKATLIVIVSVKVQNKNKNLIQRKEQQQNRKKWLNLRKKNKNNIVNNN